MGSMDNRAQNTRRPWSCPQEREQKATEDVIWVDTQVLKLDTQAFATCLTLAHANLGCMTYFYQFPSVHK